MLCKFYQKGYCKYGDSCRFVHENYDEEEYYDSNRSGHYGRSDDGYVNKKSQQHFSTRYDYNEQGDYRRQNSYKPRSNQQYALDNRGTHNNRFEQFERNKVETNYEVDDEDEQNLELLQNDMKEWKSSNTMWQLSCYGLRNHSPNIPGFEEFSVEEVRFAYMKARDEGNLTQYHQWLNGIADTNYKMRKQFSYLTDRGRNYALDLVRKLTSEANNDGKQMTSNLFKSSSSSTHTSPFSSGAFQNPPVEAHKKVFGAVNQQSGSIFQQQQQSANIFQQQQQQTANVFQQQPQQQPANIFQQQPQQTASIFQQQPTSFFQQQQTPQQNPFQKTNIFQQRQHPADVANAFQTHQPQSSPFQQQQQPTFQQPQQQFNAFFNQPHGNSIFSSSQPASNPPSVFGGGGVGFASTRGAASDAFGGSSLGASAGRNVDFYTGMDCLMDDDLREFQSETFTFVPAVPPPKELV